MKYAFLGGGKMAGAFIRGMLRARLCAPAEITVSDHFAAGLEALAAATSVHTAASNAEAARTAEVILLCVKPADAVPALQQAGEAVQGKLIISIVTGLKINALEAAAPGCRVLRTMPNTAAMVGKSATALASGASATKADLEIATAILEAVGTVYPVTEDQLDAVTGLSGSGPAFIYLVIEALTEGGIAMGLSPKLAADLAAQTLAGAAEMVLSLIHI